MFFSLLVENLTLALIQRYPIPGFADAIVALLNPIYELFQSIGI